MTRRPKNPSEKPSPAATRKADSKDVADAHVRIAEALSESRKNRHHLDCHCRKHLGQFCTAADGLWQRALNRELENLHREKQ